MRHFRYSRYILLIPIVVLAFAALACNVSFGNPSINPIPSQIFQPNPATNPTEIVITAQPLPTELAQIVPTQAPLNVPASINEEQSLLVALYKRVNPSVVNITIFSNATGQGAQGQVVPMAEGSGFVFDNDRHIVTNAHVVQGADQIEVTFADGTIAEAKLVGSDLNSDLAVVQVDQLPAGVGPLPLLTDMNALSVGQTVVALGNPFGLNGTLTEGIISALGRDIPALTQYTIPQSIQTDAAINPGNSGGPLLNLEGRVIGVNAQIETGGTTNANTGVGFAIPASIVEKTVPQLIKTGHMQWAWLGVTGPSGGLDPLQAQAMKLPANTRGAYISTVTSGGPADQAGMQGSTGTATVNNRRVEIGGDTVIAINGQQIKSFDDMLVYIAMQTTPNQTVKMTILRNGKQQDLSLKLGVRPEELNQQQQPVNPFQP